MNRPVRFISLRRVSGDDQDSGIRQHESDARGGRYVARIVEAEKNTGSRHQKREGYERPGELRVIVHRDEGEAHCMEGMFGRKAVVVQRCDQGGNVGQRVAGALAASRLFHGLVDDQRRAACDQHVQAGQKTLPAVHQGEDGVQGDRRTREHVLEQAQGPPKGR